MVEQDQYPVQVTVVVEVEQLPQEQELHQVDLLTVMQVELELLLLLVHRLLHIQLEEQEE